MASRISGGGGGAGPAGPQGADGATGPAGADGATGPAGDTGPSGVLAAVAPITYDSGTQTVGLTLGTTAGTAAEGNHTHDGRYYTEAEVDSLLGALAPKASPTFTGGITVTGRIAQTGPGGANNTAVGTASLNSVTNGAANTAIGDTALAGGNLGTSVGVGYGAGKMSAGSDNVCLGYNSGRGVTSTSGLIAIGTEAGQQGNYSTFVGHVAGSAATGQFQTGVGAGAARNATGANNQAFGYECLLTLSSGTDNTGLGYQAGRALTTGSRNIFAGAQAGRYSTTQSNELFINSFDRSDRAGDIAKSIIYGVQDATAANQAIRFNVGQMGFYGQTAVSKPTGVTVDAAGIHAALVTLGLIAA